MQPTCRKIARRISGAEVTEVQESCEAARCRIDQGIARVWVSVHPGGGPDPRRRRASGLPDVSEVGQPASRESFPNHVRALRQGLGPYRIAWGVRGGCYMQRRKHPSEINASILAAARP